MLIADMPDLPSPVALPDADNANGESAKAENNIDEYLRYG